MSLILDDIGQPSAAAIGQALGVHPRTVARWLAVDVAPRPAILALWWLTRWGMSTVDAEAGRACDLATARAAVLDREVAALRHELARVVALGGWLSANDPTMLAGPLPSQRVRGL